jgi:hypothetical protein
VITCIDPNYSGERIIQWLEYSKAHKFSVGDYLIKYERVIPGNQWEIEKFSDNVDDDVWRKYKVTFKDSYDIPHIQRVKVTGELSAVRFPLVNVDLTSFRYELDPDYETYILLGLEDEYDPQGKFNHRIQGN